MTYRGMVRYSDNDNGGALSRDSFLSSKRARREGVAKFLRNALNCNRKSWWGLNVVQRNLVNGGVQSVGGSFSSGVSYMVGGTAAYGATNAVLCVKVRNPGDETFVQQVL